MPTVKPKEVPSDLRPYKFHGVDLSWRSNSKEASGTCPWCGREGKFSVRIDNGLWKCFPCSASGNKGSGNTAVFLQRLLEDSQLATSDADYEELRGERRLLYSDTLKSWRVCKSILSGDWIMPGYSADGKLGQVYKYGYIGEKRRMLATPTMGQKLYGINLFDEKKQIVYLCEGPWDAMALWEVLGRAKPAENGFHATGNPEKSLLANANVLAVPGCNTFFESWVSLFAGKTVRVMYDNDHPRRHPTTGKVADSPGYTSMKKVAEILASAPMPPIEIQYLSWGEKGYDESLPSGYDVRDLLSSPA